MADRLAAFALSLIALPVLAAGVAIDKIWTLLGRYDDA